MSILYTEVIDEMFTTAKAIIDGCADIIGYVPETRWQGVPKGPKPAMDKFWLRVSQQVVTESQASLSNVDDRRLWETVGLLYVQLFCPRNAVNSIVNGRLLAVRLRNAFRQQSLSNEIWYRNQKVVELAETSDNYPINVVIQFEFKTLQSKTYAGALGGDMPLKNFVIVGIQNNINRIFTLDSVPTTLMFFWNGELQKAPDDYILVGNTVTMTTAPKAIDNLQAIGT